MSNSAPRFIFLTYLSRSGSTLLANRLADLKEVGVGIEAGIRDGWIRGEPVCLTTPEELSNYIKILYSDEKFLEWRVPETELLDHLKTQSFPLRFADILAGALRIYLKREYGVFVHKNGHLFRCADRVESEVPEARFIHMDRDPRAIFNSQSKSNRSVDGNPMQSRVMHFALDYADAKRRIQRLKQKENFLLVDYEEMVRDFDREFARVVAFIGVGTEVEENRISYYEQIPEKQKALHTLVESGSPQTQRIFAWANELTLEEILFLNVLFPPPRGWKAYRKNLRKTDYLRAWPKVILHLCRYAYATCTIGLGIYPPPYLTPGKTV